MILVVAICAVFSAAAVAASLFAVWRSQALATMADQRARAGLEQCEESVRALRVSVESLADQLRDQTPPAPASIASPLAPKSGFNLSKRTQVLRMHRKGDSPHQIASSLDVPVQEVDLLIKVHRIVINNL